MQNDVIPRSTEMLGPISPEQERLPVLQVYVPGSLVAWSRRKALWSL